MHLETENISFDAVNEFIIYIGLLKIGRFWSLTLFYHQFSF